MTVKAADNKTLKDMIASSEPMQLLDVRTLQEYLYLGHIPGTTLIPINELAGRWQELDPKKKTVVICQHAIRSTDASHYLEAQGFKDIYNYIEGMAQWDGPLKKADPNQSNPQEDLPQTIEGDTH